ncbi:MAG: hypothetical protein ACOY9J_03760 [Pseudomonadota bacterium]
MASSEPAGWLPVAVTLCICLAACSERPAPVQPAAIVAAEGVFVPMPEGFLSSSPVLAAECNLESQNSKPWGQEALVLERAALVQIVGWVVDARLGRVPDVVYLRAEAEAGGASSWMAPLRPALERPDVVSYLGGNVAFLRAGFSGAVDVQALPAGTYRLHLVHNIDGQTTLCDNGRRIVVQ